MAATPPWYNMGVRLVAKYLEPRHRCFASRRTMSKEHQKNARPSSRGKHEEGQARKLKDKGKEKADKRRKKQQRKRPRPQKEK